MKNDIVVYTAICGNYDTLKEPQIISKNCDYICFSDKKLKSKVWKLRKFDKFLSDNTRTTRRVKILPHKYFSEYKYSVWVDANIKIKSDISSLVYSLLSKEKNPMAVFEHTAKRKSIRDEVNRCIQLNKDSKEIMEKQIQNYFNLGFPEEIKKFPTTYIIFRNHNDKKIKSSMEDWWNELCKYSKRDQISLPFVIWKNNLNVRLIP